MPLGEGLSLTTLSTMTTGKPIALTPILSPKDADLYRAIFKTQTVADWTTADRAIALLVDRRLMGHVLADRYQRRMATAAELQAWLTAYADLPQANTLYKQARHLGDIRGLTKPQTSALGSGGGYGASAGFRTQGQDTGLSRTLWGSGLQAWRHGDAARAGDIFAQLATQTGLSSWDLAAAQFWAYRAFKRAGQAQQAYDWLRKTADQDRSFYGLLARDLLERARVWSWQVPDLTAVNQATLAAYPAGARALALVQIGRLDLAESELMRLNPQGRRGLQDAMLALATAMSSPALTLRLGGLAIRDDGQPYDGALYPVPPWQPTRGFQVERPLLYALMRHESRFDPTAVSARGACGLMQVMPATARFMETEKTGRGAVARSCANGLLDPVENMSVGQTYIEHLAEQPKIKNNLLLLLAAYNGGPNRLDSWLDADMKKDPLLFIESLPVRETRDYIQHVLIHYAMYQERLGQRVTVFGQLARGEWPHYRLQEFAPPPQDTAALPAKTIRLAGNAFP